MGLNKMKTIRNNSGMLCLKISPVLLALLISFPEGDIYARKGKTLFFTDLDARWTVDKADYGRTASVNPLVRLPLELAWKNRAGRSIGATPSAADEYIFVTTKDRRIVILNRDSGERVERRTFKGAFGGSVLIQGVRMFFNTRSPDGKVYCTEINTKEKHIERKIGPAVSSPILEQGRLFLFNQFGKVLCLNPEVGFRNWETQLKGKIEYAPVYIDPFLYVPTLEGNIYKLDSSNGVRSGSLDLGRHLFGDLSSDGYFLFCALASGKVICFEPDSLKKEWEVNIGHSVFSGPVYSNGAPYVCTRDGWLVKLAAEDGSQVWKARLNGIAVAPPSVTGDYAFTGTKSGDLAAFDIASGERLWSRKIEEGLSVSPLVYKDYVYYCSDRGTVYAFHAK